MDSPYPSYRKKVTFILNATGSVLDQFLGSVNSGREKQQDPKRQKQTYRVFRLIMVADKLILRNLTMTYAEILLFRSIWKTKLE